MTKSFKAFGLAIMAIMLLSACSSSYADEKENVAKSVESSFKAKPEKVNNSTKDIKLHLPFGVEVKKESPNNLVLVNGSKKYLLFYNPHENADSNVVYESTLKQEKEWDSDETYTEDGKFGYMLIKQLKEDTYKLVVGIGGVKVTTETKANKIEKDAEEMMKIANSVKFK